MIAAILREKDMQKMSEVTKMILMKKRFPVTRVSGALLLCLMYKQAGGGPAKPGSLYQDPRVARHTPGRWAAEFEPILAWRRGRSEK